MEVRVKFHNADRGLAAELFSTIFTLETGRLCSHDIVSSTPVFVKYKSLLTFSGSPMGDFDCSWISLFS